MTQNYTDRFELERPALISIAYQMLGERAVAQDLVQDTWEIWNKADKANIDSPSAWLRRVISRLAIDALRSARVRREMYIGPWLPEPLLDRQQSGPDDAFMLAKDCELALVWAMERLTPEERSAFILRKVFDSDYSEIADLLGKTEPACRQLVSRASKSVTDTKLKFKVNPVETSLLLGKFAKACVSMNHDEVLSLLAPDVVSVSDGGGRVRAALRPLVGAQEVTNVLLAIMRKGPTTQAGELAMVNGQPAIIVSGSGGQNMVLTIGI
ncbi:MAG: RNA polymerase sigma factor SigJ, partial [Arenicella sp.]|nr:RNA polymerase sigma factor SigJ [Arenicella sp.]